MYIDLKPLIKQLEPKQVVGVNPTLAILKYGDRPDSTNYIESIYNKADKLEINTIVQDLRSAENIESKITEVQELANAILPLNPFPGKLQEIIKGKLDRIKDVDNFTDKSLFNNCTAEAVLEILNFLNIKRQERIIIIGRHIGLEIALSLLKADYSPTICHSKTSDLKLYTQDANVIITATGVKNLITKDMVKVNSTVIDVGLGDIEEDVILKAYVTPIRNGVGAVTTQILLKHILETVY